MWVEIALIAGCLQTARNAFARSLVGKISPALNSWSRFAFNFPPLFPLICFLGIKDNKDKERTLTTEPSPFIPGVHS